jgi:hypothetical protein
MKNRMRIIIVVGLVLIFGFGFLFDLLEKTPTVPNTESDILIGTARGK